MLASFPSDSIQQWCTQLQLTLDSEAVKLVTDDLNCRLREIFFDVSQHIKHSGRRRATVGDVDKALKYVRFNGNVGLGCRTSSRFQTDYTSTDDQLRRDNPLLDLDILSDNRVDLEFQPLQAACSTDWLVLEGRVTEHANPRPREGLADLCLFGDVHNKYLEQSVKAILCDNPTTFHRILTDFSSNPNLAVVVPSLLNSIFVGLHNFHEKPSIMVRLLSSLLALLMNEYLIFSGKKTSSACLAIVNYCIKKQIDMPSEDLIDFRQKAAHVLRKFLERSSNHLNRLEQAIQASLLTDSLSGDTVSLFGCVESLHILGCQSAILSNLRRYSELLENLPIESSPLDRLRMEGLALHTQSILQTCLISALDESTIDLVLNNNPIDLDFDVVDEYFHSVIPTLPPVTYGLVPRLQRTIITKSTQKIEPVTIDRPDVRQRIEEIFSRRKPPAVEVPEPQNPDLLKTEGLIVPDDFIVGLDQQPDSASRVRFSLRRRHVTPQEFHSKLNELHSKFSPLLKSRPKRTKARSRASGIPHSSADVYSVL